MWLWRNAAAAAAEPPPLVSPSARRAAGTLAAMLALAVIAFSAPAAAFAATLSVASDMQDVYAFGTSFEHDNPYPALSDDQKATVDDLLYNKLRVRAVKLWLTVGQMDLLRDVYKGGGIIDHARQNGVKEIMYGPTCCPKGTPDAFTTALVADIKQARDDYGVTFDATGIANEPDGRVATGDFIQIVKDLRQKLDAIGMQKTKKIIGLENSGTIAVLPAYQALANDPEAKNDLTALSSHSYYDFPSRAAATIVTANNWEYWMTEAGGDVVNGSAENDWGFGFTVGGRYLNDVEASASRTGSTSFRLAKITATCTRNLSCARASAGAADASSSIPVSIILRRSAKCSIPAPTSIL